jgi:hypothetical protein
VGGAGVALTQAVSTIAATVSKLTSVKILRDILIFLLLKFETG